MNEVGADDDCMQSLSSKVAKKAKKKAASKGKIQQRVFVLPDEYKDNAIIVSLKDPHTGEGRKYLLSSEDEHDGKTICEIIKYSEDPHSWFIGDTVQKDGSLYMCTPVDPLFLLLPYLMKSGKGHYVLLNQMLEDPDYPHVSKLESYIDDSQLANICDITTSSVVTAGTLYRFNEEKTMKWLQKKIERLVTVLQEEQVDVGGSSKSSLLKRSNSQRNFNAVDRVNYATTMVSTYLPPMLSAKLTSGISTTSTQDTVEPSKKRKKVTNANPDAPLEDYTKFNMPQASSRSKLTPAQKAIAKVDKSNTKLTNFFSKNK
ncbi:ribonuclease H2 subunit B-like [Dysidea avara]|uniref:ribonuclease H2 subunit B-like n=1 Tax=Dysidea avara TaxID=196820 RepID=UPI0033271102